MRRADGAGADNGFAGGAQSLDLALALIGHALAASLLDQETVGCVPGEIVKSSRLRAGVRVATAASQRGPSRTVTSVSRRRSDQARKSRN